MNSYFSLFADAYDAAGRRTQRTLENGTYTVYDYDNANQMTSLVHQKSDQTVISSCAYGYDDAGQRLWVKRANGKGDVYAYDATDQLTNVLYEATNPDTSPSAWTNDVRYAFDAAGNRTSVTVSNSAGQTTTSYTANGLNQYTDVGGNEPSYDLNGNMFNDGAGPWLSSFDRENRMISAEIDGGTTIVYQYDTFNRLIARVKDQTTTTRFYYDDQWRLLAEYDGSDNLVRKYVYGPEMDEPVRMLDAANGNAKYYYHAAALGTVTEITDDNGDLVERYAYDVYGAPQMWGGSGNAISVSQIGNRLLFQGRDRDPDTGLYNFRNRYYSPGLGRFVQVDPMRVEIWQDSDSPPNAMQLNTYLFVANDSVTHTDPLGLWQICSPWCKVGRGLKCRICIGNKPPGEPEPNLTPNALRAPNTGDHPPADLSLMHASAQSAEFASVLAARFPIVIWIQCKY